MFANVRVLILAALVTAGLLVTSGAAQAQHRRVYVGGGYHGGYAPSYYHGGVYPAGYANYSAPGYVYPAAGSYYSGATYYQPSTWHAGSVYTPSYYGTYYHVGLTYTPYHRGYIIRH